MQVIFLKVTKLLKERKIDDEECYSAEQHG